MKPEKRTILTDPQFLFDRSGKKSLVVLNIEDYQSLVERFNDSSDSDKKIPVKESEYKPTGRKSKATSGDFYGIFKSENSDYVIQIAEDKQVFYDI